MHTRYNIKARTVALGMSMKELRFLVEQRGIRCSLSQLSVSIHTDSLVRPPKYDVVCEMADKILTELEEKASAKA